MRKSGRDCLPLEPLLHAYCRERATHPSSGPRQLAIAQALATFFSPRFLETATTAELAAQLVPFYMACVPWPLHETTLRSRVAFLRHGLMHLLAGTDPLPLRLENCLSPRGAYHVPGLGCAFWGTLAQGMDPARHPSWTPQSLLGLQRLGMAAWPANAGPAAVYSGMISAYGRIQSLASELSAGDIDHFLELVARLSGRNLDWQPAVDPVAQAILAMRQQQALRQRLRERGQELAHAQDKIQQALTTRDAGLLLNTLALVDPAGSSRERLCQERSTWLLHWVEQLWTSPTPLTALANFWQEDPLSGAGLGLAAAVLHLRDPQQFALNNAAVRQGLLRVDDSSDPALPALAGYALLNEASVWLRERYQLHPLETPAVLAELGRQPAHDRHIGPRFGGFCADTFMFLQELAENNQRDWMDKERSRYRFAVRQPLQELCQSLAERYIAPVLHGVHSWNLEMAARSGKALTSICRNAYGKGSPYNTEQWITFHRRHPSGARDEAQLFVRLDANGLRYGLRIGRKARSAVACFRHNVQRHADALWSRLTDTGALAECQFGQAEGSGTLHRLAGPAALWEWASGRSFEIACLRPADDPLLASDELVGHILLTFDRLLPAFACAMELEAGPFLGQTSPAPSIRYGEEQFLSDTGLSTEWLGRVNGLLQIKRQLILQGVPGTGKTHVARCLGRYLSGGRDSSVRLVQFHPAYSYEEFVEGIKVRSVEIAGRQEVTYPVEEGVLCAFAAAAAKEPAQPHVLIIDEINRGNLPRLFGELLFLLEYRQQSIQLPQSRREFQLPDNLYLIGTMNAADRSVVLLDQALRRRFSIVDMPPDARILASYLTTHEPTEGPAFAMRILRVFERLNARLQRDVGPRGQIGHSCFMVPDLTAERLRMIWQHQVRPLVEDHLVGQPRLLAEYSLDALLEEREGASRRRRPATVPQ